MIVKYVWIGTEDTHCGCSCDTAPLVAFFSQEKAEQWQTKDIMNRCIYRLQVE